MSTTTKPPVAANPLKQRDAKIAEYNKLAEELAKAQKAEDKAAALSAGAKMANRSREIRQLELDIRLAETEGESFGDWSPWAKPASNNTRSRPLVSQEQVETDLAKVYRIVSGEFDEETKHAADVRITALLRQAERAGYKVRDPRKNSK